MQISSMNVCYRLSPTPPWLKRHSNTRKWRLTLTVTANFVCYFFCSFLYSGLSSSYESEWTVSYPWYFLIIYIYTHTHTYVCVCVCACVGGRDSSVGIAARYGLDGPGIEFQLWWGGGGRNLPHPSTPALGAHSSASYTRVQDHSRG